VCDIPVTAGEQYALDIVKYQTTAPGTHVGVAWYNYDPNAE
jgi:hypothetical protein